VDIDLIEPSPYQPRTRFREEAGILFQKTALQDFLTVRQCLALFRGLYARGLTVDEVLRLCSLGALAAGLRDLLVVLGHERATLVGHSLGGGIAMQFAYQFPEMTERLVLVSSGGLGPEVSPVLRAAALPGADLFIAATAAAGALTHLVTHRGEMLPMMMARADDVFAQDIAHLQRPISATIVDQVWITTSGIFTQPPFLAALLTFGIDRIMFSVDYPYASNAKGRAFLDRLSLARADMAKLSHENADGLLKLSVRSG
jgi:pimeloyl-ACP methyl ester carboxylesterase